MRRCTEVERYKFIEAIYQHTKPVDINAPRFKAVRGPAHEWFAKRLMRYGTTLGRIAENQCNGYQTWDHKWDEKAAARDELKEERIKAKVTELCAQFGCKPVFQGDPRGNVLKIQVPDGYTSDWGREGICVPTS